jgi:hypothetical protein
VLEVVAALLGQLRIAAPSLGVGVVVDLAGVLAVGDLEPGGDDVVGAEHLADRLDHLGAEVDTMTTSRPASVVLLDQGDGLVVDERVDDVVQRVGDDLLDGRDVPAGESCDMNCRIFSIWSWSAPPTR